MVTTGTSHSFMLIHGEMNYKFIISDALVFYTANVTESQAAYPSCAPLLHHVD
jgi:hypothetical protein